ncbi:MAG TPA: D-alanine--D-alanine ligase family protein [Candidatus Absconditabacterales bacterium]|nr:D-alanine--D-alanine ligase family protein [Candidatus Absconditabacterales bacterium]
MKKIGLIFGGMSNEAEVSISSAKNIIENFDYNRYELIKIFRSKNNKFYKINKIEDTENLMDEQEIHTKDFKSFIDIIFPITHGKFGEDGILQSILELEKLPYCGCRVLSSSLCMNKAILKRFLNKNGIKQVKFSIIDYTLDNEEKITNKISKIKNNFELPIYIKPSNSGSSIGITKLTDRSKLNFAISEAKKHDDIILIEQGLEKPQEIEVGILGNGEIICSTPGELVKDYDFYSFNEKYIENRMTIEVPAKLEEENNHKIKKIAQEIYTLCDCKGFARLDFFIDKGAIYFNEVNTIPGFTEISAFPVLMKSTGMTYTEIINKIIELAY